MGNAADVPELGSHLAAMLVYGVGNVAPAGYLFGAVNAGGVGVALAGRGDLRAFADDQSGIGALAVVLAHQLGGNVVRVVRPFAGQRGHDDTVGKRNGPGSQRGQQAVGRHETELQ